MEADPREAFPYVQLRSRPDTCDEVLVRPPRYGSQSSLPTTSHNGSQKYVVSAAELTLVSRLTYQTQGPSASRRPPTLPRTTARTGDSAPLPARARRSPGSQPPTRRSLTATRSSRHWGQGTGVGYTPLLRVFASSCPICRNSQARTISSTTSSSRPR